MKKPDKIEEIKFIISRFDHYYDSINNKGNLYLTINTFILGGVLAGFSVLNNVYNFGLCIKILLAFTLLSNIFSNIYTLLAIKPYLSNCRLKSVVYFNDIASLSSTNHQSSWSDLKTNNYIKDLVYQSHSLAIGLKKKFTYLQYATWFIAIQIFCIVLFGIFILTF